MWLLCSSAWDMPSVFADAGIDFMSVSDWNFFMQTVKDMTTDNTGLFFGDLNFSELVPMRLQKEDEEKIVLANPNPIIVNGVEYAPVEYLFTEEMYNDSIMYIREMIGFIHKGRKPANKATAKILIMDDRKNRKRQNKDQYESMFHNGIISLVNTEEFPYTYETVFDITVYQFTKSLLQIQGKKQACAMLQGSMSGFVDTSKIPSSSFQWTYSEEKYNKHHGKSLKDSLAPNGASLNIKPMNADTIKH